MEQKSRNENALYEHKNKPTIHVMEEHGKNYVHIPLAFLTNCSQSLCHNRLEERCQQDTFKGIPNF
jgi:hypothetical protein